MRGRASTAILDNSKSVGAARWVGAVRALRLVLLLGAALLVVPRQAAAQSTTSVLSPISSPNGSITLVPNAQGIKRTDEYYERRDRLDTTISRPWWISYRDCLANDVITFSLTVRDTSDPLEIWAGSENCATSRSRTDRGQCWIVASEAQLSDTVEIAVPVRNVVARRLNITTPPVSVGPEVCDDSTDPSGEAITFYFMLVDSGQADEYFAWDGGTGGTGFDVVGPDPPGSIDVGIGENQLAIKIDDVREETDRERFEAFCVPRGTTRADIGLGPEAVDAGGGSLLDAGSALDGGISLDAGASGSDGTSSGSSDAGGGAAPAACFTEILVEGRRPPEAFSCGSARETSTTLRTSTLRNDVTYAVAIAAQDNLGNAGVASDIQCGTPTELEDFFELYSRYGGPGGGGFCSVSPAGMARGRSGVGASAAVLALLLGLALRRRRSSP